MAKHELPVQSSQLWGWDVGCASSRGYGIRGCSPEPWALKPALRTSECCQNQRPGVTLKEILGSFSKVSLNLCRTFIRSERIFSVIHQETCNPSSPKVPALTALCLHLRGSEPSLPSLAGRQAHDYPEGALGPKRFCGLHGS